MTKYLINNFLKKKHFSHIMIIAVILTYTLKMQYIISGKERHITSSHYSHSQKMNAAALPTFSFLFDLEPQPRAAHTQARSSLLI